MAGRLYIIYNENRSAGQYSVDKKHVSAYPTLDIAFWCCQIQWINNL